MSAQLTPTQQDALDYLYGSGDETVECFSVVWVQTRYKHVCCSVYHGQKPKTIPPESQAVMETAKVDGRFGTAYTCLDCMVAAEAELGER